MAPQPEAGTRGSDLLIQVGKPEELLPKLLDNKSVVVTQEPTKTSKPRAKYIAPKFKWVEKTLTPIIFCLRFTVYVCLCVVFDVYTYS